MKSQSKSARVRGNSNALQSNRLFNHTRKNGFVVKFNKRCVKQQRKLNFIRFAASRARSVVALPDSARNFFVVENSCLARRCKNAK